jgi:hypothetical protein
MDRSSFIRLTDPPDPDHDPSGTPIQQRVIQPGLHQGITCALDLTHGNAREVRKFSRHAKLETVMLYDDNRDDVAADISRKLGRDC